HFRADASGCGAVHDSGIGRTLMLKGSRTPRPAAALSRAVAATVEPLELRRLLSSVVYTDIDADTIPDVIVTGTSGTDRVTVYVDLGSGNDNFEFSSPTAPLSSNISNALSLAAKTPIDSDPDGADITEGGDLVLQVDGGNDKDTINFDFSRTSVICSSLIA